MATDRLPGDFSRTDADERFRFLIDEVGIGMQRLDAAGRLTEVNAALCRMLGRTRDSLLASTIDDLTHPEDRARRRTLHEALFAGSIPSYMLEKRFQHEAGHWIWLRLTTVLTDADDPERRSALTVIEDITEHKLAEERRQGDEARYRAIVDTAVDAIAVIDERGIVQSFNRSAERLFGYDVAMVVGSNVSLLMPEPDCSRHDCYLAGYRETGQAKIIGIGREVQGRRRDGSVFPLELSIAEWRDANGRYFTGVMRDVTERKRAQEALQRLAATLEQRVLERTGALETANARLTEQMLSLQRAQKALQEVQKMEAVGRLTGGIAHDFNNLLTTIIGNLGMMSEAALDKPDLQQLLAAAQRAATRGAQLTAQLLAFARRQTLRPEVTSINTLIQDCRQLIARLGVESIEIAFALGGDLWPSLVDPAQLQSAVLNLVINARDAMPNGGRLTISTRNVVLDEAAASGISEISPGPYVELAMADSGTGMSADVLGRAFEPFFTTKEGGKGTGLGLSQVFGFARQSGGSATIDSSVGAGTTVRVYLPRAGGEPAAAAAPREQTAEPGTGEAILVVEDDPAVLETAVNILKRLNYNPRIATSGRAALDMLADGARVDLVFTDIVMPGELDGIALAREIQRRFPGLKILLTTGHAGRHYTPDAPVEFFPVLLKPYRRHELAAKLREVLIAP